MRIYLAILFIFILNSCTKKSNRDSARASGGQHSSTCAETAVNALERKKIMTRCEPLSRPCNNRLENKIPICSQGAILEPGKITNESPRDWYSRFRAERMNGSILPNGTAFLDKIIIVRRQGNYITPVKTGDRSQWEYLPVTLVDDSDIDFILQANNEKMENGNDPDAMVEEIDENSQASVNHCETSYETIASCFNVDGILDVSYELWTLHFYNRNIGKAIEVVRDVKEFGDSYSQWVRSHINFDGMILDEKPGLILAVTAKKYLTRGSQALTIANSLDMTMNPAMTKTYVGLLELMAQDEKYSIFRIPLKRYDRKYFIPGTKLDFFPRADAIAH